jgi:hypothetical protein
MLFQVIQERKQLHTRTQNEHETSNTAEETVLGLLIIVIHSVLQTAKVRVKWNTAEVLWMINSENLLRK